MRRIMVVLVALAVTAAVAASCGSDDPASDATVVITTTTIAATTPTDAGSTTSGATTLVPATTGATTTLVASVRTTLAPVTAPPTSPKPTVAATTTTIRTPQLISFNVTPPAPCNAPEDVPLVILTWSFTNVDTLYVAVDDENGPYQTSLPPTGELQVPYGCPGPHTYFAVALGAGQRVVGQKVVNPTPTTTTTIDPAVSSTAP